jgi:hypothetical protein
MALHRSQFKDIQCTDDPKKIIAIGHYGDAELDGSPEALHGYLVTVPDHASLTPKLERRFLR